MVISVDHQTLNKMKAKLHWIYQKMVVDELDSTSKLLGEICQAESIDGDKEMAYEQLIISLHKKLTTHDDEMKAKATQKVQRKCKAPRPAPLPPQPPTLVRQNAMLPRQCEACLTEQLNQQAHMFCTKGCLRLDSDSD